MLCLNGRERERPSTRSWHVTRSLCKPERIDLPNTILELISILGISLDYVPALSQQTTHCETGSSQFFDVR